MKDSEIRGLVLRAFYERRREGRRFWRPDDVPGINPVDFYRIVGQLAQHDLLEWYPLENGSGNVIAGNGQINANGVDVIEGIAKSPITITFDQRQTVSITGSNNIVGDCNLMSVEEIRSAISHSNFSEAEKAEAKSLWQKVSENKLLNTVIGSVFGAATKHVLESTNPR
ncbi:MAG TPA: hypothetical protein VFB55_08445 [Verrucomicrobiae bacterium]|nr:hypothetical protein [Verrucomicrobiae bacterium]